jgi:drug/metabolite transporter (DMT)-like permease
MHLQRRQPSIPLLTQDTFTAVILPDHVDIVIRNDRRRQFSLKRSAPTRARRPPYWDLPTPWFNAAVQSGVPPDIHVFGYSRHMKTSMLVGLIAATLAAFSWSLSFIVPFIIGDYSLFDFALVEFVFSGILSVGLLWWNAPTVRKLSLNDWLAGCSLGLIGYVGYFLAVMGAAVYAGPVIAPAFLGLVPVILGVAGNLREHTVSWASLGVPLGLAALGLFLVNSSGLLQAGALQSKSLLLGIPLAILAVTFWTSFGLLNQSALAKRPTMDAGVWTALIMVGAGLAMLLFFPIGMLFDLFEIPRLGLHWETAGPLIMWATGLAIFANLGGATAWTFASQRLPVALAAQMITIEPTSATILGLLVHHRWPSMTEALGMIVLLAGVVIAIGIFSKLPVVAQARALPQH